MQLAEAENLCVEMAGHALAQLGKVLGALRGGDVALADDVVAGDDLIDDDYIELESRILTLLATQAPVATDLRLVSVLLHVNIALERVGDLCTNIAKNVKLAVDLPVSESIMTALEEMGAHAAREIDVAMQSFTRRDLELAEQLSGMDESISRLNRRMIEEVAAVAGDEQRLRWAMRMLLVSRWLERIGDHAVDIAEQVAFLITGTMREFKDASHGSH
jgi:phosphate transport system protein